MPQPHISRSRTDRSTREAALVLASPAFADGARVPVVYTADGAGISPPLTWSHGPPGTMSFALVCEDPDAPSGVFVHWLVWNLEGSSTSLREALPSVAEAHGIRQGVNGFGRIGWAGPSPPRGKPHRYVFRLYALDAVLGLQAPARRADFDRAVLPHVLAEGRLIGTYGR